MDSILILIFGAVWASGIILAFMFRNFCTRNDSCQARFPQKLKIMIICTLNIISSEGFGGGVIDSVFS